MDFKDMPMKPMMIVPPDMMSDDNLKLLRDNGICVVVAEKPEAIKFLDPIPAAASRTQIEHAAIMLSRKLLGPESPWGGSTRDSVAKMFVDLLVTGTPLDPKPSIQEIERQIFHAEKAEEIRRIAREEARAERLAAKAAKAKPVK